MQDEFKHHHRAPAAEGRRPSCLLALVLAALLSHGCATTQEEDSEESYPEAAEAAANPEENDTDEPTVVAYRDYRDPLIRFNRAVFAFNDVSYRYVLIPIGRGYLNVVPEPAQRSIGNFFYNIKTPIYVVNNALQLDPGALGTNLLRFGINTTVGLFGLFDPAQSWFGLERAESSIADTLAFYGVGYGVYIVVPLLGPSDLRAGTSALTEAYLHPISYITDPEDRIPIQALDYLQEYAPVGLQYENLREESEDPYIFFRNLYLQGIQRDAEYQ